MMANSSGKSNKTSKFATESGVAVQESLIYLLRIMIVVMLNVCMLGIAGYQVV